MAVVWKQIPPEEAETRTRAILEIITSELRRMKDEQSSTKMERTVCQKDCRHSEPAEV